MLTGSRADVLAQRATRDYIDRVLAMNPQDADYQVVTAALDKLDNE